MNNSISIADFNTICRICLVSKSNMITSISPMTIYMLETCTSVQQISNEKMPQQICIDCYEQLKIAFNFKQQYLISIRILSEIILQSENCIKGENSTETIVIKTEYHTDEDSDDTKRDLSNDIVEKNELSIKEETDVESSTNLFAVESNINNVNFLNKFPDDCKKSDDEQRIDSDSSSTDKILRKIKQKCKRVGKNEYDKKKVVCDTCGKKIRQKYLSRHLQTHSENRPYECDICHVKFKQVYNLNSHKRIIHATDNHTREICFICGKFVKHSLKSHLQTHKQLNERERYQCDKCNKIYTRASSLRSHMHFKHSADGVKTYTCKICNKTVKSALNQHIRLMHSGVKREHTCRHCNRSFKIKSHLNDHIRTIHLNERPHSCTMCEKSFHTRRILTNHMRTHTGERPFSCDTCKKTFSFPAALAAHMKVHTK